MSHPLCELSLLSADPALDELDRGEQPWAEWGRWWLWSIRQASVRT
jgi:hypothetical protein